MPSTKRTVGVTLVFFLAVFRTRPQTANQTQGTAPDVLICKDGEKFIGQLVSSSDASVVFKSASAGQVTVDWAKVQELHSSSNFAVYRRVGFTGGGIDNYLNDSPPGFKKNSFTLTFGATYSIQ